MSHFFLFFMSYFFLLSSLNQLLKCTFPFYPPAIEFPFGQVPLDAWPFSIFFSANRNRYHETWITTKKSNQSYSNFSFFGSPLIQSNRMATKDRKNYCVLLKGSRIYRWDLLLHSSKIYYWRTAPNESVYWQHQKPSRVNQMKSVNTINTFDNAKYIIAWNY